MGIFVRSFGQLKSKSLGTLDLVGFVLYIRLLFSISPYPYFIPPLRIACIYSCIHICILFVLRWVLVRVRSGP